MSGPSWRNTPFDFAAAPRNCSRSKLPTAGMSRSMMNLRNAITALPLFTTGSREFARSERGAKAQVLTAGAAADHAPENPITRTSHGQRPPPLSTAAPRHAAAGALPRLRQHAKARAETTADPLRAHIVRNDGAGVRG